MPDLELISLPTSCVIRGSGLPRSTDTLHISEVIRSLGETLQLKDFMFDTENGWDVSLAGEFGFMWEDALSFILANRSVERPDELMYDGIAMSPDGIDYEDDMIRLHESKATWKSNRKDPREIWKWMVQVMSYCKALGLTECNLHVLWVCGDWNMKKFTGPTYGPKRGEYNYYRLKFSQKEIDDNWLMLKGHATGMMSRGYTLEGQR